VRDRPGSVAAGGQLLTSSTLLAAISVGRYFGLSLDEMAAALRGVKPGAMRLDVSVRADGTLIIDDAYNANPVSMRGAP